MCMEAECDIRIQPCIQNSGDVFQFFRFHQSVGVNDRQRIGFHIICQSGYFKQFLVRITGDGGKLKEHLIAKCLDLPAKRHCRNQPVLLERHTDTVKKGLRTGLQVF